MNVEVKVLNPGDVEAFLEDRGERVVAAIRAQMGLAELDLLAYIKDEKLSGQVLNQRTGNLKNSGFIETGESAGTVTGFVGFGRTVPYAAAQNYGAYIPEVSGKLMVFEVGAQTIFTMRRRAFDLPARNFMESSLEERTPAITEGFRKAIAEVTGA